MTPNEGNLNPDELSLDDLSSINNFDEDIYFDNVDEQYAISNPNFVKKVGNWLKQHWRGVTFAGALAVGTIGGAAYVATHDVDYAGLAKQIDIAAVGRDLIDAAEVGGPVLLGAAGLHLGLLGTTRPGRKDLQLARRGLNSNNHGVLRRVAAGALLPAIGVGALTNALMIEQGIHKGADANIVSIDRGITTQFPNKKIMWDMENGTSHFMNDSQITHEQFSRVQTAISSGKYPGVYGAQPFFRDLVTIPTRFNGEQAGMVFSLSGLGDKPSPALPEVKPGALCKIVDERCNLKPNDIIIDENEGFKIGDEVDIRGHKFNVVAFPKQDQSLVNRLIAYTGVDEEKVKDRNYFGFITLVDSEEEAKKMMAGIGISNQLDQETTAEFIDANNAFWFHNGTTLMFLMIADISLFAGTTFAAIKNFEHERNLPVIATMKALGTSARQLAVQQYARSSMITAKGVIPGFAGAAVATEAINKNLVGFHGETTWQMAGAASGLVLLTQFAATAKMMHSMRGKAEAEMMKSGS